MILFCCSSFGFSSADRAIIAVKSNKTIYKIGQKIRVTVNIGQNGFIYLFNIRPDGMVDLLIPNRFSDGDSRSWAREARNFPELDSGRDFIAPDPPGKTNLIALLVPTSVKLEGFAKYLPGCPFATIAVRGLVNLEKVLKNRVPFGTSRADASYLVAGVK